MRSQAIRLFLYFKELNFKKVEGKKVLFLFVVTNLIYSLMIFITIPKVMSFTEGMKIFDMMPMGYKLEYTVLLLNKLGSAGRNAYLFNQIPVDFIYPGMFGITYCLLLAYVLNKLSSWKVHYLFLCFLPIIACFFDYLENFGVIFLIVSYPQISYNAVHLCSVFTILKSLFSTIYFIVLFSVLVIIAARKLMKKELINYFFSF